MATYQAVAAVSQTILTVLEKARASSEFADADFSLSSADDFHSPTKYGVSLYLYRVGINSMMKNAFTVSRVAHQNALPLELHYILTARGADALSEQRLLAWTMTVLAGKTIFSSEELNQAHAGIFKEDEAVELLIDNVPLADIISLWKAMQHPYRVSIPYLARGVNIYQ